MARKWQQAGTQVITSSKSTPAKEAAGVLQIMTQERKRRKKKGGDTPRGAALRETRNRWR